MSYVYLVIGSAVIGAIIGMFVAGLINFFLIFFRGE